MTRNCKTNLIYNEMSLHLKKICQINLSYLKIPVARVPDIHSVSDYKEQSYRNSAEISGNFKERTMGRSNSRNVLFASK